MRRHDIYLVGLVAGRAPESRLPGGPPYSHCRPWTDLQREVPSGSCNTAS